ncbi:MAG TPA: hypothetical protein QGG32_02530 [Rhodospirillales bacterium]|jgi:hypothetical protein|nr:hypothetical protein [Rhodospirillales bacterium]
MAGVKSRTFTWRFDSPVGKVWPGLADSARFNEAAELPKHEIEEIPRNDGSVLYIGRARIRHQNNTLILGPGGYEFGDYCRMGLPLEVLIFIVAMPMVLWVWPL